jgi:ATP-dependent DNA helicase RecQ
MTTSSDRASRGAQRAPDGAAPADPLADIARRYLGVTYLYPVQRFVISNILEGADQVVILPTGTGKSLCFQAPALVLPGPTLVILPLLSLLEDQLRRLAAAPAAALRGGLTREEKDGLFARVRSGAVRILLATPEACLVPATAAALAACRFAHMVVDEAHCVSEWGRSFRPAYRELGGLRARLAVPCLTAFTATASATVVADVKGLLFAGAEVRVVEAPPDRPNIFYRVQPALSRHRALTALLAGGRGPAVVFCRTRRETERAARELARRLPGRRAAFYHAGLDREERQEVECWFLASRDGVLCATSAYGMGVDKPDIRMVVHLGPPPSVEAYLQETGRAGRDGAPAQAVLVAAPGDDARGWAGAAAGGPAAASLAPDASPDPAADPGPPDAGPDPGPDGRGSSLPDEVAAARRRAMLGYAQARNGCRRQALLSLIGKEAGPCAGCDVCDGSALHSPEGEAEILGFIRAHQRRFSPEKAAEILAGAGGPRVVRGHLDREAGYGLLSGWEPQDVRAALETLLRSGALAVILWGPWRGTLRRGRSLLQGSRPRAYPPPD